MEFLSQFYQAKNDQELLINSEQASAFAKQIAGDYNPIHDPDSRRFCVPGDLLFAIALDKYGLNSKMAFQFLSLIGADSVLSYPELDTGVVEHEIEVVNDKGKPVLGLQFSGQSTKEGAKLEQVLRQYVPVSYTHLTLPTKRIV